MGIVTAGQRAAEAIAANPLKSNRAIAEDLVICEPTVRRARKSHASHDAPGTPDRFKDFWRTK
jgi:hypothetical protein